MRNLTPNIETVRFHGRELVASKDGGIIRVAMKPICEVLGLDWKSQHRRIQKNAVLASTMVMMTIVAEDGKHREMVTLPLEMLNGWLFGIEVGRVKAELRESLIAYQKECFLVLDSHFRRGRVISSAKLTGAQILATQRHVQKLMRDVAKERNPSNRRVLHDMLDQSCRMLGVRTPELSVLNKDDAHD